MCANCFVFYLSQEIAVLYKLWNQNMSRQSRVVEFSEHLHDLSKGTGIAYFCHTTKLGILQKSEKIKQKSENDTSDH